MKNTFIATLLLLTFSTCLAQSPFDKGVYSLGGGLSFSNSSTETNSTKRTSYTVNISPEFDYFIINNLSVGITTTLRAQYIKISDIKRSSYSFFYGCNAGYYFDLKKIKPFIRMAYGNKQLNESSVMDRNGEYSIFSIGFENFISKNVAIESYMQYSHEKGDFEYKSESMKQYNSSAMVKTFSIGMGIRLFIF